MGSSPGLRGGLVSRNAATISSTLLPSTPEAANSLALTFTTHLRAMRMLLLEIDQEPKKKTARNIRAVHISRRLASEPLVPRIERLPTQGTVVSPARLPGSG